MSKKTAIISYYSSPLNMQKTVKMILDNVDNPDTFQFIFFIHQNNKPCKDMVNKLYMRYPPSLFSKDQQPTIRVVCKKDDSCWKDDCIKCAGDKQKIIIPKDYPSSNVVSFINKNSIPQYELSSR